MAITTRDGLIAALAASTLNNFTKVSTTTVAGFYYTLWRTAGRPGTGATLPTASGRTLSRTSAGALTIPAASGQSYLGAFAARAGTAGTLILCDRLVETGALVMNVITAQTVNSVALPARATGLDDVELWLEIHTLGGTTASASVTASYTNQDGTAGRTATLVGGIPATGTPVQRSYQMALQAGDLGVQSVQTVTLGTSTGTAGVLGVTLRRSLIAGTIPTANLGFTFGYPECDLAMIGDDAALELMWLPTTTSTGVVSGYVSIAQG